MAFQHKIRAFFIKGNKTNQFNFSEKFSEGPGVTWQVRRGVFDKLLADEVEKRNVEIIYGHRVIEVDLSSVYPLLIVQNDKGENSQIICRFILDASGYGRVLPRILDMETPSDLPVRRAIFTHIQDNITDTTYDRNKISIIVHELDDKTWFWLIPFSDGISSVGVVSEMDFFERFKTGDEQKDTLDPLFKRILHSETRLSQLLQNAQFKTSFREIKGYSANVKQLFGENFALLGNAGEFLDPVIFSGY